MTKNQTATQRLIATAALLTAAQEPFKAGDVIVWKSPELSNKSIPAAGQPAVVTRTFATPVVAAQSPATVYFNEPLDIAAITFAEDDDDSEALEYHYDSRRFRLATRAEIDAWDAK